MSNERKLLFYESPVVEFASNFFIDVPVILQYGHTPLVEVVKSVDAGVTTQFNLYHSDGTYLAKVKGTQIYCTADGKSAGLRMRYPDKLTVCEMNGKTLFEVERQGPAALKAQAELHAPDGTFLRCRHEGIAAMRNADALQLRGVFMAECRFTGCSIGVLIRPDGGLSLGVAGAAVVAAPSASK